LTELTFELSSLVQIIGAIVGGTATIAFFVGKWYAGSHNENTKLKNENKKLKEQRKAVATVLQKGDILTDWEDLVKDKPQLAEFLRQNPDLVEVFDDMIKVDKNNG